MNEINPGTSVRFWSNLFTQPVHIELRGIERIPEEERNHSPWSFFFMSLAGLFSLGFVAFGWLPILFGLSLMDAVTSVIAGVTLGCLLVAPLILIGVRTATTNPITSIAFFGIRGRLVAAIMLIFSNLMIVSISLWAGVDTLFASAERLTDGDIIPGWHLAMYGMIILAAGIVAVVGFDLMLRFETLISMISAILFVLIMIAFIPLMDFGHSGGDHVLGDRWLTWLLSCILVGISGPISYVLGIGDWTRYISIKRYTSVQILLPSLCGIWLGLILSTLIGVFLSIAIFHGTEDFVYGLVQYAPDWNLPIMILLGILSSFAFATVAFYGAGLALQAVIPNLTRLTSTVIIIVLCNAIVYTGVIYSNLAEFILTFAAGLLVFVTPWLMIILLGHWMNKGQYDYDSLSANLPDPECSQYWYSKGWNLHAVTAMALGVLFGLMTIQLPPDLFGPWSNLLGGVDISFLGAGIVSSCAYLLLRWNQA